MLIGMLGGAVAGLIYDRVRTPFYQASAKFVFRQTGPPSRTMSPSASDARLANTYAEIASTRALANLASRQLGYPVSWMRVSARQVGSAPMVEVDVVDEDPARAAQIANTLVDLLIAQQVSLRTSVFADSEASVKTQLSDIEAQLAAMQANAVSDANRLREQQLTEVGKQISDYQAQIATLQQEIVNLKFGTSLDPAFRASYRRGIILPTPSVDTLLSLAAKESRLEDLNTVLGFYVDVQTRLNNTDRPAVGGGSVAVKNISLDKYQQVYASLLHRYEDIRLTLTQNTPTLTVVEPAMPPRLPVEPAPLIYALLGGLFGLLGAAGLAFIRVHNDETFRTPEEVQAALRLPELARLHGRYSDQPDLPKLVTDLRARIAPDGIKIPGGKWMPQGITIPPVERVDGKADGHFAVEPVMLLHSTLALMDPLRQLHTLLIACPDDALAGAWLAVQMGQSITRGEGLPVLLVDANLRHPEVARLLDMPDSPGLGDVLEGRETLVSAIRAHGEAGLSLLAAGTLQDAPPDQLTRAAFQPLLENLCERAEMVIVVGPPSAFAEITTLSACVDGVLLLVELNRTQAPAALHALEQMRTSRANVVGMVLG